MKIISDTFKLEVNYSELKDIYEALKERRIIEAAKYGNGGIPQEFYERGKRLFELSVVLGLQDDFNLYDRTFKKNVERMIEVNKIKAKMI